MSAAMALRLAMVSSSDSPLEAELRAMSSVYTSALRRVAAMSKVVRVRVLFSKNRLNTLLPRSSGTFLTSRSLTLTKLSAVSRIWLMMARGRPSVESRCTSSPFLLSWGFFMLSALGCQGTNGLDHKTESALLVLRQFQRPVRRQRNAGGRVVGLYGQFT